MLDNLVNVQARNKHKRKQAARRKTLNQWLLEYEDVPLYEPLKNKRSKFAAQEQDYRDYVSRPTKRDSRRRTLRDEKWAVND